ncbi:hypothetical protein [Neptuniibacter sp. QD37_11]|uniref:hypothetical protein n=1 Tax=Neptuniibacter sp. QD37_11 TaxID=3398209 RepID=UPI0039F4C6AF
MPATTNATLFTLIYSQRDTDADALISLNGPSIHTSRESALNEVWQYVRGRILSEYCIEFSEEHVNVDDMVEDLEGDTDSLPDGIVAFYEGAVSGLEGPALIFFMDTMTIEQIQAAVNWFFNMVRNACTEAFFVIDEHQVTLPRDLTYVKQLWAQLGDIPVTPDEDIEEPFLHFEVGTGREEIWDWFENQFDISVPEDLMFPIVDKEIVRDRRLKPDELTG